MICRHLTGSFHTINSPSAQAALGKGIEITNAGGAGFKAWEVVKVGKRYFFSGRALSKIGLLLIFQGSQDAYVHVTLIKKWDICAPAAILAAINKDGLQVRLIIKKNSLAKIFNSPFAIAPHNKRILWQRF